jgi:HD-GYP domain-containing protein (c-di-GMP phosphodiesterase class II)
MDILTKHRAVSRAGPRERALFHSLAVGLRTAELHEPDNETVASMVAGFMKKLGDGKPTGPTRLSLRNHCVFVDDDRLDIGASDYLDFRYLMRVFDKWQLGGLAFDPEVSPAEVRELLFAVARGRGEGIEALSVLLEQRGVSNVTLKPPFLDSPGATERQVPLRTYSACLDVCRDMQEAVKHNRQLSTRRLRRVAQSVVDQVLDDEYALLALTTIKEFDDYLFHHSANVAILSVAMGQRLGYPKARLGELCLAAFLHDMGKIEVDKDILGKSGRLEDWEWEEMREHPVHVVHLLLEQEHLSLSTLRAIVAGFEHHLNHDMSGYPKVRQKRSISTFGRIITVADRYDALTTPRPYRVRNFTPYEGVRYLLRNSGTQFDPLLVRVFIDITGLYPPGTVVVLDSGEVGVVQRPPLPGSPIDRPQVLLTSEDRRIVNLSEQDEQGRHRRSIRQVVNPSNKGLMLALHPLELHI